MELKVMNDQGQQTATLAAADAVFGREYNEALVHQMVVAYQANARLGTRAQLNREAVHHSTRKPWRQKGTGRARAGMSSSNIWRGGGRAFPNSPEENFTQKVNKKMYRAAMAVIFSKLAQDGRLIVVDSFDVDMPKTKNLAAKFKAMGLNNALVLTNDISENLDLASRNLKDFWVDVPRYLNPVWLLKFDNVVVTKAAVETLEEMLG